MQENSKVYAEAKAKRTFIEQYLKTVKAQLMAESGEKTLGAQETYAYSHDKYIEQLNGLRAAVEIEENLRFLLKAAELKVEIWKTYSYNQRAEMKLQ